MEAPTPVEPRTDGDHRPAGAPPPTLDDPTAGGTLCGSRRSPRQIADDPTSWPYCRKRAGWGTDHPGQDRCRLHAGNTPSAREAARRSRLRLAELADPAIAALARVIADQEAPASAKVRAAEAILDRAGYPRRLEIDVEAGRETLVERLAALQQSREAES